MPDRAHTPLTRNAYAHTPREAALAITNIDNHTPDPDQRALLYQALGLIPFLPADQRDATDVRADNTLHRLQQEA